MFFEVKKKPNMLESVLHWLPAWLPGVAPGPRLRALATAVLQAGPTPQHVAIIMDGNRRYARRHHAAPIAGHAAGFAALQRVLEWGLALGIGTVTVYAFSLENFKRPPAEVDGLMALARDKFRRMLDKTWAVFFVFLKNFISTLPSHT
jgi:ditrans,polycis-polyprenyl diphosphate synthase